MTQEHTLSLPFHTNTVRTTSDLTYLLFYKYIKYKTITRIEGTDYTWCTGNHRAPNSLLEPIAQP